jgi:hypothetical protein
LQICFGRYISLRNPTTLKPLRYYTTFPKAFSHDPFVYGQPLNITGTGYDNTARVAIPDQTHANSGTHRYVIQTWSVFSAGVASGVNGFYLAIGR